jgi:hypothetical protein
MGQYSFTLRNNSTGNITQVNNASMRVIEKSLENFKKKENLNTQIPLEIMKRSRKIRSKKDTTNRH